MFDINKTKKEIFSFELENQLKADKKKQAILLEDTSKKEQLLKNLIRQGAPKEQFAHLNTLLKGYQALHKVIKAIK